MARFLDSKKLGNWKQSALNEGFINRKISTIFYTKELIVRLY